MKIAYNLFFILMVASIFGCDEEETVNTLTVSKDKIEIAKEGGTASFIINTDADSWAIESSSAEWLSISISSGTQKEALIGLSVDTKTIVTRADTLVIKAGNANPVQVIISQASSEYLFDLSTNRTYADFNFYASSASMDISSDTPEWKLTCDADWITLSQETGALGTTTVTIRVITNTDTEGRAAKIVLSADNAPSSEIPITQKGTYPSYNTNPISPDNVGMTSTAVELAAKMLIGWNIGNTLEAIGGETAWGNPTITEALIQLVKQNGFNAIRIPCSWNQYLENSATAEIKSVWLDRVKQVVQYCVDNEMYVLLNIHWDGGWLENNCNPASREANNAKQKAFWEQIATELRDFDEHLLFASANEPNVEDATQMAVLNSYHQTFIDAVRSTGGKNSYRVLVVQGPSTDIEKTNNLMSVLPTDKIANKMMVEIHYYSPYQFCLMTEDAGWGKMFYYWGSANHSTTDTQRNPTWGEEPFVDNMMTLMNTQFVSNGIPVILGEYGAIRRTTLTGDNLNLHLASRASYLKYVTAKAIANGIIPFYWDEGSISDKGMGIFNRKNNTVFDQTALDALIQGATK